MPAKYIGLLIFIWVVAALIGGVMEKQWLGTREQGILDCVLSFQTISEEQDIGTTELPGPISGLVHFIQSSFGWLNSVWKMVTFQFAFIHDEWILVKWLVLGPLMGTIVFGLITMFFGMFQRSV